MAALEVRNSSLPVCTAAHSACCAGVENFCLDNIDSSGAGVVLEVILLCSAFVAVAVVADEHLVVGLETLCVRWGIREDVAGASFMAFGSAAPEIIINAIATIKMVLSSQVSGAGELSTGCLCDDTCAGDDSSLGIGAIIGSGMIAFTFIPGCCGLSARMALQLKRRPLGRDILFYLIALVLLDHVMSDGEISVGEAGAMVALYAAYLSLVVFASKMRETYRVRYLGRARRSNTSFVVQAQETLTSATERHADGCATPTRSNRDSSTACTVSMPPFLTPVGLLPSQHVSDQPSASESMHTPMFGAQSSSALPLALPAVPHEGPPPACILPAFDISMASPSRVDSNAPAQTQPLLARALLVSRSVGSMAIAPLKLVLRMTCPDCGHDSPRAWLYPITLLGSFCWLSLFSTVIAAVVSRWGALLCIPTSFLGLYVIAIGAEIPDTIQSVTVARRGYGSMAVSNSTGSQIINILIGLGMPWLITTAAGQAVHIPLASVDTLHLMAMIQGCNVIFYLSLLLLPTVRTWRPGDHSKASLGPRKGVALLTAYLVAVAVFPVFQSILLGSS